MKKAKSFILTVSHTETFTNNKRNSYRHQERSLDETPQEHLERVLLEYPDLEGYISVASYETAREVSPEITFCWSHCFIFSTSKIKCLIVPGAIINIKERIFEIMGH